MSDSEHATVVIQGAYGGESEAQAKAMAAEQEAKELIVECQSLVVASGKDREFAAQVLADIKGERKRMEELRTFFTQPLYETLERFRKFFRFPINTYKQCEKIVGDKIAQSRDEAIHQQQQALHAARERALVGDQDGAAAAMQQAHALEPERIQGLSYRENWQYEVVDIREVPLEFLTVNDMVVRQVIALNKGMTNIPGLRVFCKTTTASRST